MRNRSRRFLHLSFVSLIVVPQVALLFADEPVQTTLLQILK
jgi:hypothetical protein